MSGDVQPRKRKDKRRKKDVSNVPAEYRAQKMRVVLEDLPGSEDVGSNTLSSDETIHVHKDTGTGGNICAKVVFFLLLGALAVMVGLILTEYRGSSDVDTPVTESRWAQVFDGLVDESLLKHEEHGQLTEQSGEHDEEHSEEAEEHGEGELDEHGEEGEEEEEEEEEEVVDSEETQSPEQDEDEPISDEIEDGQEEEEEEEEEEEDEEVEELEVSEEELKDIPGVTESDEDEEEDDESTGAEEDVDDVASEEAGREEEEAEGEDSDEDEGDVDDDSDDGDNEAVEELGGEETEGDREGDLEDKDGVIDDTEEEPSGVALKFGVGVALVLVAHVVLVRKWNADDGTTVQTAASAQASDTDRGVEEIVPELIERRQTLISQDDLEGSEYSEEEEGEEEEEEEEPQKVETFEDYIAKYRPQAVTKKELISEEQRISPAESEEEEDEEKYTKEDSDEEEEEEEESEEEEEEQPRVISAPLQKSTRAAYVSPEESGTEESEEEEVLPARRATKTSGGQAYGKADITSKDDLKISEHLDLADAELDEDLDI